MNRFVRIICIALLTGIVGSFHASAILNVPNLPEEGVMDRPNNGLIDPDVDYEVFIGRVSDKDDKGRILKIKVENNNTKFLNAGDELQFQVAEQKSRHYCRASVRSTEDFYFVIYVEDFNACWGRDRYFPRGMMLHFRSRTMARRVFEASEYRKILIMRKEGFLKQLNDINHFLWTYSQQKMKLAAEYDERINELRKQKQVALDNMLQEKQESILLQTELSRKLDELDLALKHYTVERREQLKDRWNQDHDQALPVGHRPQSVKIK